MTLSGPGPAGRCSGTPVPHRCQPGRPAIHLRLAAPPAGPAGAGTQPGRASAARPCRPGGGHRPAPHLLYHLPDPRAGVRELRRITRPGGQALVILNGRDHLRELRDLSAAAFGAVTGRRPPPMHEPLGLDDGQDLLASEFTSITRHEFTGQLLIPGPGPVEDYVRSMTIARGLPDPGVLAAAVAGHLSAGGRQLFRVRTHSGCLVCS